MRLLVFGLDIAEALNGTNAFRESQGGADLEVQSQGAARDPYSPDKRRKPLDGVTIHIGEIKMLLPSQVRVRLVWSSLYAPSHNVITSVPQGF